MSRPSPVPAEFLDRALALHRECVVFDAHVDTLSEMRDKRYDLGTAPPEAHLSWERIEAAGLNAQLFACFVPPDRIPGRCREHVDALIDRFEEEVARYPDRMAACRTGNEIESALAAGKLAGILAIEGGHAIEDSLDTLRHFHARGVRAMTLTWNNTNSWADACGPMDSGLPVHGGLTRFGEEVVGTMEEIGMAVDISHVAPATFGRVLEIAGRSPFASHSSCRAVNDHRRNLFDEHMRGLAEKGGVMGVCFCSGFVRDESAAWARAKAAPGYEAIGEKTDAVDFAGISAEEIPYYDEHVPLAGLQDAVDHVDHALRVMGTEAVGLGTDFDGARRFPRGLSHLGQLPNLTAGLLARGWKEDELRGFLGENFRRYFGRILA